MCVHEYAVDWLGRSEFWSERLCPSVRKFDVLPVSSFLLVLPLAEVTRVCVRFVFSFKRVSPHRFSTAHAGGWSGFAQERTKLL